MAPCQTRQARVRPCQKLSPIRAATSYAAGEAQRCVGERHEGRMDEVAQKVVMWRV